MSLPDRGRRVRYGKLRFPSCTPFHPPGAPLPLALSSTVTCQKTFFDKLPVSKTTPGRISGKGKVTFIRSLTLLYVREFCVIDVCLSLQSRSRAMRPDAHMGELFRIRW